MSNVVSIVIPTYNCRRWLGEAIDSALAQTYPHCEAIVVDDGSTDGTGEWVQEAYGDSVRYVWQENRGRAGARNRGLAEARGEYIQFLDADDLILPQKVTLHVDALEANPDYAAVYSHVKVFQDGRPDVTWDWRGLGRYQSGNLLSSIVETGYLIPTAMLIRSSWLHRVGGFDESFVRREDTDLWYRLCLAGAQFLYLPGEALSLYRYHGLGTPEDRLQQSLDGVRALHKLEKAIPDPSQRRQLRLRRAMGVKRFELGVNLARCGKRWKGWREVLVATWLDPRNIKVKLVYLSLIPTLDVGTIEKALELLSTLRDLSSSRLGGRLAASQVPEND